MIRPLTREIVQGGGTIAAGLVQSVTCSAMASSETSPTRDQGVDRSKQAEVAFGDRGKHDLGAETMAEQVEPREGY